LAPLRLLSPRHDFATRFGLLLALCAMGAALFGALVIMLGGMDRAMLRGMFRPKDPPVAVAGQPSDAPR
jgi:hypothetical protein